MTQPFWEVELAKQQGKLINSAMDYSAQSRTAPAFAMQPLTPSPTASAWQPARTSPPAQTYAPASRSAPIVLRHPPITPHATRMHRKQSGMMRPPAAHTASREELPLDLGARQKSLTSPPGWLAGVLVAVAGYVGSQLRQPEAPPLQASAVSHPVVPVHATRAKVK